MPKYANAGLLEPLDAYLKDSSLTDPKVLAYDDLIKATLDCFNYEGKQYGMPFFAACVMMYYRKDVFEEKGVKPPETPGRIDPRGQKDPQPGNAVYRHAGSGRTPQHLALVSVSVRLRRPLLQGLSQGPHPQSRHARSDQGHRGLCRSDRELLHPGRGQHHLRRRGHRHAAGTGGHGLGKGAPLGSRILDPERSRVVGKVGFGVVPRGPAGVFPPFSAQAYLIQRRPVTIKRRPTCSCSGTPASIHSKRSP